MTASLLNKISLPELLGGNSNKTQFKDTGGSHTSASCGCLSCNIAGKVRDARNTFTTSGGVGQFNASSSKWAQSSPGSPVNITYAFDNDLSLNGITTATAKQLFKKALGVWAKYSPLNFVEIKDPGNGRDVDILAQDDFIDGRGNTLAFAFFPRWGDITFDDGEQWNESLFLETAVHEIGHSLGLGHEGSQPAIMNPSIQNRYRNQSEPFLLDDDIAGIQTLYGKGSGSVKSLGGNPTPAPMPTPTPTPPPTPSPNPNRNLVINGNFERNSIDQNNFGIFSQIRGWTTTFGRGIQLDKRTNQYGKAARGNTWVELDSFGNSGMRQRLNTQADQNYRLSFQYTPRAGIAAASNGIQVVWDGKVLDTLTGAGNQKNDWKRFDYVVRGSNGSDTNLEFRAVGSSDNFGGFIDNVVVRQQAVNNATDTLVDTLGSSSPGSALPSQLPNHEQPLMASCGQTGLPPSALDSQMASMI
ncbi:MAG: matrixin family metalloprotease [Cyanobacteria bacterium P01_D01_bin.44]